MNKILNLEPVLLAFAVSAVPIVAAFIVAVSNSTDDTTVAILTGAGPLIGALTAAWARAKVTPLAKPTAEDGTPLTPPGI